MAEAEFYQKLAKLKDKWMREDIDQLSAEFSEARILRLASLKPAKLSDLQQARQIMLDITKLRLFLTDVPHMPGRRPGPKPKRGWNISRVYEYRESKYDYKYYWTSTSKIAKFQLLIEDLDERIRQLESEERQAVEAMSRAEKASMQFAGVAEDKGLAGALWHALDSTPPTVGYVYLKRWTLPDGSCWFKVGITNNRDRREAEQNVLPVAAETIACVDVGSMDRARAIEAIIHQVLEEQRITDANNRELFHLSPQQASVVKAVLERLE